MAELKLPPQALWLILGKLPVAPERAKNNLRVQVSTPPLDDQTFYVPRIYTRGLPQTDCQVSLLTVPTCERETQHVSQIVDPAHDW